jgi:four helix bundle protein
MSDYRKLSVWAKAKDLAVAVYRAVAGSRVSRDFGLRDQMLRASVSIASNIAEGYTRETPQDKAHFLTIARGSCAELETQLIIASEAGLIGAPGAGELIERSQEVSRMLYALRERMRKGDA